MGELFAPGTTMEAGFSVDRVYRYWLTRVWDEKLAALVVVGLNPSTADERTDDPTIRKVCGFARRWGYGSVVMLNLFAFRSTDPSGLLTVADPIGTANDQFLTSRAAGRDVLCAWGNGGELHGRGAAVGRLLRGLARELFCFGLTKRGEPLHPLYLANASTTRAFAPEEAPRG